MVVISRLPLLELATFSLIVAILILSFLSLAFILHFRQKCLASPPLLRFSSLSSLRILLISSASLRSVSHPHLRRQPLPLPAPCHPLPRIPRAFPPPHLPLPPQLLNKAADNSTKVVLRDRLFTFDVRFPPLLCFIRLSLVKVNLRKNRTNGAKLGRDETEMEQEAAQTQRMAAARKF